MGDEKILQDIGYRINRRRKELGLTQENLAEKMDVSIQMISNLELGKKAIRPENLIKLCNSLNVSADYILMGVTCDSNNSVLSEKIRNLSPTDQGLVERLVDRLNYN